MITLSRKEKIYIENQEDFFKDSEEDDITEYSIHDILKNKGLLTQIIRDEKMKTLLSNNRNRETDSV